MTNETLLEFIEKQLVDPFESTLDDYGMLNVYVSKLQIVGLVSALKQSGYIYLTDLCAVHYPERVDREFEVVYHLHDFHANHRIRLKVALPKSDLSIPTMTTVFVGSNWMERETFDFFGIQFDGHPDLRRILNMESMDYHPLRKEYALEDETRNDKNDKFFGR